MRLMTVRQTSNWNWLATFANVTRRAKGSFVKNGEYAMIKAAAANGWIDERSAALEALISIKRAGACAILSYYSIAAARWLKE